MNIQDRNAPQRVSPTALFIAGVVTALCVGLVGGADYDQEVADARFTCNMVSVQAWPSAYKPDCKLPHQAAHAPQVTEQVAKL
jgi:hypothetical protein